MKKYVALIPLERVEDGSKIAVGETFDREYDDDTERYMIERGMIELFKEPEAKIEEEPIATKLSAKRKASLPIKTVE